MNVYAEYQAPQGEGGLFLKIEDGKTVRIRLTGEPYIYIDDKFGSTRYAWVVFNQDENKAQVFEQGVTGYRAIAALAVDEDWGDPTEYDLKVTREGTEKTTKYHFSPSPKRTALTDEQKSLVAAVDMAKVNPQAVPLAQVAQGKEVPKVKKPLEVDATIDDKGNINLDDIPF